MRKKSDKETVKRNVRTDTPRRKPGEALAAYQERCKQHMEAREALATS